MKIRNYFFLIGFILLAGFSKGQSKDTWQLLGISIDGTNGFSGVQAYFKLTTCNGVEQVQVKLVNNNNYAVRAGWRNFIYTNDGKQLSGRVAQDSVNIAAKSEVKADCGVNTPGLVLKLSDFDTDAANFKTFVTGDFDFVIIH
jgi:hypothetical protein